MCIRDRDATVVVDDKGNATVTTPEGKTAVIPAADLTKDPAAATKPNAGNDIVKPADKTAVKDPANLTPVSYTHLDVYKRQRFTWWK